MKKGKLIVVEGACDGIGKTTQYQMLRDHLINDGHRIVCHHFPTYGEYQGTLVEKYLADEFGFPRELSPYFVNSLYATDRAVTWHQKLKPLYDKGHTILLDRYTPSSIIYQSALIEDEKEKKNFFHFVEDFEYEKIGIKRPDTIIFLHAPFELVTQMRMKRKSNDGIDNDIHERALDFMRKVYDNAMFVADYLSWDKIDCSNGNAENPNLRTVLEIHEDIYRLVKLKK